MRLELAEIVATTPESKPLWDALAEGRLLLQRCGSCERLRFPPVASCPYCSTPGGEWEDVEPRGTLYSWVVTHMPFDEDFADEVPYAIGTVELEGGSRIFARLSDVEPAQLRAGMPMVGYPHPEQGLPYLRFRPAPGDDG